MKMTDSEKPILEEIREWHQDINPDIDEFPFYLSYKGRKVKASIDIGDFIIDVNMNGFIAGIEILNASENLKLTEEQLSSLQEASMVVNYKPNYVVI